MKDQVNGRFSAAMAMCVAVCLGLASPAGATVYTLTHPDDAVFG